MTTAIDNTPVAFASGDKRVVVTTVTYDNAQAVTAGGPATGALIGGPVGAAAGVIAGSAVGASADTDPTVVAYVRIKTVDPL
jgi:hypothetical protein